MWINDAGEAMKLLEPPRATTLLGMKDKKKILSKTKK